MPARPIEASLLGRLPGGEHARGALDYALAGIDRGWYSWRASVPGEEAFTGVDFVEFAPDGRIARLTNFYDS